MNLEFKRKLPTPQTVKDMYPVTEELARQKQETTGRSRPSSPGRISG